MTSRTILIAALLALTLGLTACAAVQTTPGDSALAAPPVEGIAAGFNSAAIIVREGLEAVLIIAVILGYMKTTRRDPKYSRLIFIGVGAAILLSLVTWWVAATIIAFTDANKELLEGVTSLVAVGVLFYCTNWLFHKAYVVDWMTFIKTEAGKALATGSVLGLVALGFTVVYREGFETVLFYQTMLFNGDSAPVLLGFAVGTVILIGLAIAALKLSVKLPIRPFFTVTGALMLLLAFKFMGMGVHALQEAHVFGETPLAFIPTSTVLTDIFGVYPALEPLLAQIGLLILVGVTFAVSHWVWKRGGTVTESA